MAVSKILYVAAGLCTVYFIIVAVYTGLVSKFHLIWLAFGVILFGLAVVLGKHQAGVIHILLWIRIALGVACVIFACIFIWAEALIISRGQERPDADAKYMIVLGTQVRGTEITRPLQYRLDTAITYLEENPQTIVIVSGGQGAGEDISEAQAMKEYLLEKGMDSSRILVEDQSVNTDENIAFSSEQMESEDDFVVVVSNAFHIYRALEICKKQGLANVQGLGAPSNRIMVPSFYLREALAVVKYKLSGQI